MGGRGRLWRRAGRFTGTDNTVTLITGLPIAWALLAAQKSHEQLLLNWPRGCGLAETEHITSDPDAGLVGEVPVILALTVRESNSVPLAEAERPSPNLSHRGQISALPACAASPRAGQSEGGWSRLSLKQFFFCFFVSTM